MHAVRLAWLKANQPDRLTLVDEVHAFQDCMEAAE